MTLGEKIKKLRNDKGLTQAELADEVHVTFQTVSKWEKDENEPDVATLRELSRIFSCSMDYLLSQSDEENKETNTEVIPVVVPVKEQPAQTVVIHQKEPHVCEYCKKDIEEGNLAIDHVTVRHGRRHTTSARYYHKECLEQKRRKEAETAKVAKAKEASDGAKKCWGWSIPAGVIVLIIVLASLLSSPEFTAGEAIGYSILSGVGIFTMIYCILSGSYISDVFLWASGLSIKFPGIIFSFDLDGLKFLIIMKLLFAVLGFIVGVLVFLFAIVLSSALSIVSFPFILANNIKNGYDEVL